MSQNVTSGCLCRGPSSLSTIAAVTLAISAASRINSTRTATGPVSSISTSTWHPKLSPTAQSTFTTLIPTVFTLPSSIGERNTSTSFSITISPSTLTSTKTTDTPSPNTDTMGITYSPFSDWYEENSSYSTTFEFVNTSSEMPTHNFTVSWNESSTDDFGHSLPEMKYNGDDLISKNDTNYEEQPLTVRVPIVALLSGETGKYLPKRSVESNEDDYDYEPWEPPTASPFETTWISDDTTKTDAPRDYPDEDDYPSVMIPVPLNDTDPSSVLPVTSTTSDLINTSTTDMVYNSSSTPSEEDWFTTSSDPSPSTATARAILTSLPPSTTLPSTIKISEKPSTEKTMKEPSTIHTLSTEITSPGSPTVPTSTTVRSLSTTTINLKTDDVSTTVPAALFTTGTNELACSEECESTEKYHFKRRSNIDLKTRRQLNNLCWETMFGQELVKMTVMDLMMTIASTLLMDFFRAVFVRFMNNCWCWDLEKKFPQYGDFKIAENILHLVNNQGMVWMGMFFSPGLALINLTKLAVMLYLRSWAVLTCNVPHEVVFKASRSNNFYLALLLTMLFLCVLPVGYAVVRLTPSWHCGPFSGYKRTYIIFTDSLRAYVPQSFHVVLDYVASPGIVIPMLLLLSLVIYYLVSLTNSLREANIDLKIQLRHERTEERRRMFQLVERRRRGATGSSDLADKWKKLIPALPSTKDEESTIDQPSGGTRPDNAARRKELLTRLLKHALRKSSATSDDESGAGVVDPEADGDGTDAEQPDSLPEDAPTKKSVRSTGISQTVDQARRIRRQPSQATPQAQQVTSPTASSHREREDSVASAWSDNIPVIRISKTESTDCVVDLDQDFDPDPGPEEKNPTGSSDTVVAADMNDEETRNKRNGEAKTRIHEARRKETRDDDVKVEKVKHETVKDDSPCA